MLGDIGENADGYGLAALRFWGQTGERSGAWMTAADPVHLETRLNDLRLHAIGDNDLSLTDIRALFDHLQDTIGSENVAFARLGHFAYLRGAADMASAKVSSQLVHGRLLEDVRPRGEGSESHDRLLSEMQMSLHEHEINNNRERLGRPVINSLWLWGGGSAPEQSTRQILPLFSDDPLFRGFWLSRTGIAEPWLPDYAAIARFATDGFVSVIPECDRSGAPVDVLQCLRRLRALLDSRKLRELTLYFRDGLKIELSPLDRYRFWRRESPLLGDR